MKRRAAITGALLVGVASLTACYESSEVTVHRPGEYKGAADELNDQQASSRAEALKKRFQLVQIDR